MVLKKFPVCLSAAIALTVACSGGSQSPISPSAAPLVLPNAAPDGSTLKVTAPEPQAPADGAILEDFDVTLVVSASTSRFGVDVPLEYEFELYGPDLVETGTPGGGAVSHVVQLELEPNMTYTWRARAVYQGDHGPWSTQATFTAPDLQIEPYVLGSEVYDPLWTGVTAAHDWNNVTFIPNLGVRLNGKDSFVQWNISTLTDGEFSLEAIDIANSGETWKTKIMSMLDCCAVNTTLNPYRVTIDKRSEWLGQGSRVRFTMRSRGKDAGEPKGGFQSWNPDKWYFWKFEWRGGIATLTVRDNGPHGPIKEQLVVSYNAPYNPPHHAIRLGSVGGRLEPESLPNVTIRNVWVSGNPRPDFPPPD